MWSGNVQELIMGKATTSGDSVTGISVMTLAVSGEFVVWERSELLIMGKATTSGDSVTGVCVITMMVSGDLCSLFDWKQPLSVSLSPHSR